MSIPLEHNYIGLTETCSMERSSEKLSSSSSSTLSSEDEKSSALNLKETELRLGLPGSESPERKAGPGVSIFGKDLEDKNNGYSLSPLKNLVSGAKRGFSDAIDGSSGKWVFSLGNGSEVDLFSHGGGNGGNPLGGIEAKQNTQKSCLSATPNMKEAASVPQSPKPVQDKKPQVPAANEQGSAPAAKAQVVGWPPIRSFRKNTMNSNLAKIVMLKAKLDLDVFM
ncbi:hypothetical protein SLA2020_261600 [Shorea laevis]